jgi:glycosyltransferase involved in cell wall biosynthesis
VTGAQLPRIDVLVSTFNEERYVDRCLDAVRAQDYPRDAMRVLVIDGGSTDGTVARIRAHAEQDDRIEVIADGVRRNLPAALNVGLERCTGDLVAKIDAHGWPELDYLRRAAEAFAAAGDGAACVGGRPSQEGETRFGEALALARGSRVGVGGSEYAGSTEVAPVDTVQCGVYRREPLMAVGSFDPEMNFGEDEEVNWRLRRAGHEIVLDTRIRFHYITRPTWKAAYRQYRNYGAARVRVVRSHPEFLRLHHLVPAAAVAGGAALAAAAPFSPVARRALGAVAGAYGLMTGAAAVAAARPAEPALAPVVASAITALHAGYGVGMLRALPLLAERAPQEG